MICFLVAAYSIYIRLNNNKTSPNDIKIEAVLKPNSNNRMKHKNIVLEVSIEKSSDSQHMIYPYIPGLLYMTFDGNEGEEFFVPTSIGGGPGDKERVINALKNNKIMNTTIHDDQYEAIGFWVPKESGKHKTKMYFEAQDLSLINEMYLIYIHKETGFFNQDLSWSKVVKVKSEL